MPSNTVNAILQTADGLIWIGTDSGLSRYDIETNLWTVYNTDNSELPGNIVYALLQSADGAIWVEAGEGALTGQLTFTLNGNSVLFGEAEISVSVIGTDKSTMVDGEGRFTINGIPLGKYDLKIETPNLDPVTISGVDIVSGQSTNLDAFNVPLSVSDCTVCDQNGDGVIGLEEAIHALQVVSGIRASD